MKSNLKWWKIYKFTGGYAEIIVYAPTFDDALQVARKIDPEFNDGQIIDVYDENGERL